MRQFLRSPRTANAGESKQLGSNSDEVDSNANNSINTERGVITLSSVATEAGEVRGDPENNSEYGEDVEIGEPTFNPFVHLKEQWLTKKCAAQSEVNSWSHITSHPAQAAPFEVPTRQFQLSSGFPYHRQLFHYRVSPDEWSRFTDDVTRVCTLSTPAQWAIWSTGLTVGVTSSALLTVLGIPPGYYAGKAVYTKAIKRKVRQGLKEEGELEAIMKFWNETVFMQKGCKVRLELPSCKKDKENTDDGAPDHASAESEGNNKKKEKKEKRTHKFFKLIVEPLVENSSAPLIMSPGLDHLKEGSLREISHDSTNRDTVFSMPAYSPRDPPAYASGCSVQELEATSREAAVESGAREIREMPGTVKTMAD